MSSGARGSALGQHCKATRDGNTIRHERSEDPQLRASYSLSETLARPVHLLPGGPVRVAARAAAGGRPTLATFAQAVSAAQGPLTGRSAALAQARYVALVRKMTAARASTQG